ncbi:MAG TPA: hypothetical protein VF774_14065 [Pseudoduganella sp.]|jgi:hypothetical protein
MRNAAKIAAIGAWRCRRVVVAFAAMLALCAGACAATTTTAAPWPEVPLPPDAQPYPIGEQLGVNGMPMRLRGFTTDSSLERTAAWFRDHFPRPMVENKVKDRLVIGRGIGTSYYITVQLAPAGTGTRGTVSVTDFRGAAAQMAASRAANEKILAAMPSGTKLLNAMTSTDAGRNSAFFVLANTYSEEANAERVKRMLGAEGLELENDARSAAAGTAALAGLPRGAASGRTLSFRGKGREAIAVISRMPDNRVSIVLNTITAIESFK